LFIIREQILLTQQDFNVGNGYWSFTATGGSGYTYDIVLYFDPAQTGTIPADTNTVLQNLMTVELHIMLILLTVQAQVSTKNNSGFDIERKPVSSNKWTKAGSVQGRGTTNELTNYTFSERGLDNRKI
jgi:hypothetical protein